ncbi:hypothetical protein ACFUC1_05225 [Pedococcus sp. NPDC057267]|uniref:hypothetical protein n=1 Tax=Pedococcus sp. NPDC057267 TaxID=3346077 RepID=UPI0036346665
MTRDRYVGIHSLMARILYCTLLALAMLATLGGMFDPTPGPDKPEILPGGLFLALEAILFIRSLRIGLVIDTDHVASRGLIRTRKFPRPTVTQVTTAGYNGFITRGVTSGLFLMLKFEAAGRTVELPQLIGRAKVVRGLADEAQAALGLPRRPTHSDPGGTVARRESRAQREPTDHRDPS